VLAAAALALAGCTAGTSNGFTATAPGGWKDETDTAETRTGTDFEVVYEGPTVDGVIPTLTVSRVPVPKKGSVETSARTARTAVDRRLDEADPTPLAAGRIAGEPAFRFDYRAGEKRSRYVTARHGDQLYAVTVQSSVPSFDRALVVLEDYLASWRWET
jgi:hypothetical protein